MTDKFMFFMGNPTVWYALLSWPKFSMTSYRMVSSLVRQGTIPKTVIDVGANVGQFAVASARIFPEVTVHSFEPEPTSLAKLRLNVRNLDCVHVYPVALGKESGEVMFHVNSHSHSSSVLPLGEVHRAAFPCARQIYDIKVAMSTLDQELAVVSLEAPVLLKLDVQGYELQVLEGASDTLRKVDYVLLETSFRPMYEGERTFMTVVRAMEGYGFEFLRPIAWLDDPRNGEVLQMDALFARSNSAHKCAS
jgi:FkbM family methyltransferase